MSATRIGLVGCGYWGSNILRDLNALGCVVDVVDRKTGREVASARRVWSSIAELPEDIEGFVVATPSPTHDAVIRELMPRGRPIFCEKPLTTDAASAAALARDATGQLFVMHKWAYHGGVEALAKLAREGELGALRAVYTRRLQWGKPAAPVDPVWELTIHDLTIARAIIGSLPPLASARAVFADEGMAGLSATLGSDPFVHIETSARWPGTERVVRAYFENGLAMLNDPYADHIAIVAGAPEPGERHEPQDVERRAIDIEWPLTKELRAFVRHVEGGPPPPTDAAEGAEIVAALEAIRAEAKRSAGRG